MAETEPIYDVVIIGTGISGAILAKQLGQKGRTVLLLEAGVAIPNGREELMERYYLDTHKFPEAPYGNNPNAPRATIADLIGPKPDSWRDPSRTYLDQQFSTIPFGSTYERQAGGTVWHWLGTTMRMVPHDFQLASQYGQGVDWPIEYKDLASTPGSDGKSYYAMAEAEIGVSANAEDQDPGGAEGLFEKDYQFPNPGIPTSLVDNFFQTGLKGTSFEGQEIRVIPTPAGRNSRPYQNRRVCAGNTNCVPICPIQAKYDPTVTLHAALNYREVSAQFQSVATKLILDQSKTSVTGVEYIRYEKSTSPTPGTRQIARGRVYIVASNAIETPKLLLLSGMGEMNSNIGQNLMDHPLYLRWGLAQQQVFPYRGPLSTAGLDTFRDGAFRRTRSALRIEIGNDGWAFGNGDPTTTLLDQIEGIASDPTNPKGLFGRELVLKLNSIYTRQCRMAMMVEQLPEKENRVELSDYADALGIRRPRIKYSVSDYEAQGFAAASRLADQVFARLRIEDKTVDFGGPSFTQWEGKRIPFGGAGHMLGTCRMGTTKANSVVNSEQRSWDCRNLFIVGGAVFPTSGTANPTLTIAALAFQAADTIHKKDLPPNGRN